MKLLNPSSIAIIGASSTPGKVGHDIVKNLLTQGFKGAVFPVNPKHDSILDTKAYASVKDIAKPVDLAVVVVPATLVPGILEECIEKLIQNVIVISAGFAETGTDEGKDLEEQIKKIALGPTPHSLPPIPNLVGPNCLGIIRPAIHMNASFATGIPPSGSIALLSQSGAMAVGMMDSAEEVGLGFSLVASIGNTAVLNECDFLEMAAEDDATKVIGLYLENITDGARFLRAASHIAKPIVLLKSGVSIKGKEAAASHTGALAGNDAAISALCAQAGIHRAETSEELFDMLETLSLEPRLASNRIAIITNAGGPGILATDAAISAGLTLPHLSPAQEDLLKASLPAAASTGNPIDVVGDADVTRFIAALDAVGNDPNIDGVCLILTPQVMTPCAEVADAIITWKKTHPLMPIVTSFIGEQSIHEERQTLQKAGIPCFETPERAAKALGTLQISKFKIQNSKFSKNVQRTKLAHTLLKSYKGLLPENNTTKLFELYNIPVPEQKVAATEDEAVQIAEDIGYPVIAKISSPDIIHKTDIGGVKANLLTEAGVRNAFKEISSISLNPTPNPQPPNKVLIQQFQTAGEEFIVGAIRDTSFGHLVMAGLGGIYTELLEDTAFRIAPIAEDEAYRMLSELTSWELLLGMRGKDQFDIESLAKLVSGVSELVIECPQIKDIDLNPVLVTTDGILVADAKIVIG